ncbi:MAG: isoprenylcysteine carboxylmethyltransferase family protein [Candidatus Paceibacterota bacterium]|jgi:protein-S-isoprenylcysteine O-methyltransferase Ste14
MIQEKIEKYFAKRYYLKYSIPTLLTLFSIYFWITFFNFNFIKIVGIVINIVGLTVWWLAKLTLAKNWGVGFGKPKIKQLVTHGIYSKILHPMYWGINLTLVGLVLLYPKIWFSIINLLIIFYFFYRMKIEDSYLSEKLGEKYQNYKGKTWA